MGKTIRIGTRDSKLALWQADVVQQQLEYLGYKTTLVPIKSTGDMVLHQPIYKMGITGVFTRNLDIALLNEEIDIAVHSMKDVPTQLPEGIVQAAVLKRGLYHDVLVFKDNQEFLSQKNAVIATGSLRRKAQWLQRFPDHKITGLRGNISTRLEKLENNEWNGAVFAAAALKRLKIKPENVIPLTWMIPAPAQGALMITALENDEFSLTAAAKLNHKETEICTGVEREFLKIMEGGCSAPIGALATIKDEKITLEAIVLSEDGTRKKEVNKIVALHKHKYLAKDCADIVIARGAKKLISKNISVNKKYTVYASKALTTNQKYLFHKEIAVKASDFIKIRYSRIPVTVLKEPIAHVVITSKNAVAALASNFPLDKLQFKNIYCVGRRTRALIEKEIGRVNYMASNSKKLGEYLVKQLDASDEVTIFCSNIRMDNMPDMLSENEISLREIVAYKTMLSPEIVDRTPDGLLFFSPSTVQSYLSKNQAEGVAFCVGETTAKEAKKHFTQVAIAKVPTVESVIERVNEYFSDK
ncbi:MAG: hydroxymethylbilane synthase [Flavobacteriales bacterium]|nr:MAG: hydroxymethylbilane synthase [Flavobacteriales bacterium]